MLMLTLMQVGWFVAVVVGLGVAVMRVEEVVLMAEVYMSR